MMTERHAISDGQWAQVAHFFPQNGKRGRQWKDHRLMLDGVLWVLATGAPWRDLPERFGPCKTVYDRFSKWTRSGLLDRILEHLQAKRHADGKIDWDLFCVDGSVVRAHKSASGARKKGGLSMSPGTTPSAAAAAVSARNCTSSAMEPDCRSRSRSARASRTNRRG